MWSTLRALSSRTGALRTNVLTDLKSPEFVELGDELVRGEVPPADIPLREVGVGGGHCVEPFTRNLTRKFRHVRPSHLRVWMVSRMRF